MKKITFLLIALLAAMVSYSQIFIEEDFNGTTQPAGWSNFSPSSSGTQQWGFGSGVTSGGDIADFTSNAAIFNDPPGVNVSFLYKQVNITNAMSDDDYALIYAIRTSLNTFGSDTPPDTDKLSIKISDESFITSTHTIWETTTEHDPDMKYFNIKSYIQSSWNLDYSQFRIGVVFDDVDGSNGWGAGIDDVSFYARQHNDSYYSNLNSRYVISSLPYTYSQEADHQVNRTNLPTGITDHMLNGLWYKYVADFTGKLTIHGKADNYDMEIGAYRQNGGTWTFVGSKDAKLSGDLESLIINVVNGQTYWFNLGRWGGNNTAADMTGTQHIWVGKTPPNDDCANAINFTVDAHNASFTLDTTGNTSTSPVNGCGTLDSSNGVWYKFTAPYSGMYSVEVPNSGTYSGDAHMNVYTGSCGNFTCVTSVVLQGLTDNEFQVSQGVEYYININSGNNDNQIVQNGLTEIHGFYIPPANDMCANAVSLTVGDNFDQHDVIARPLGYTPTSGITSLSCISSFGFGSGSDIWYELIVPANGAVTIETASFVGSTLADTFLAAYTGTCNNLQEVACNDDGAIGNFTLLDVTGQTPGSTLYIRASEYATNNYGKFKISAYNLSTATVEDDIIEGLSLYPNPVNDILTIESQEKITQLSIYSILGKLVKTVQPNTTNSSIDLSNLATGIYMVKIEADNKVSTQKIIKK